MSTNGLKATGPAEGETGSGFGPAQPARVADEWRVHVFVTALGLIAGGAVLAFVGHAPRGYGKFNDFYREAWPAYAALAHGHLSGFFHLAPPYVGSLVLRAPVALIPRLWGGGAHAVYVAGAIPCVIAVAIFCTWLAAQPRRRGGIGWASRVFPIMCCIVNPIVLIGLFGGHPEEVLGAVLCVAAVVLASKGKLGWASLLTALAVINKPWGLVAVPVVLLALPPDRRRTPLLVSGAAAAVLVPLIVLAGATSAGIATGKIFNPPQLLWWFGPHSLIARGARIEIVFLAFACAALWWGWQSRVSRRPTRITDPLLLLALVLLLRAALDPWNNLYYHIPFLFALIAYEARAGRPPLLTVIYTLLLLIVAPVHGVPHMSPDLRAAMYAVLVLPTIGWMVAKLCDFRLGAGASRSPLVASARAVWAMPSKSR